MRIFSLLVASLCLTVAASVTSAQNLDGQWFKATATGVGAAVDGEGLVTTAKFKKLTHYVQLQLNEGGIGHSYSALIWVENSAGAWIPYGGGGGLSMLDQEETFVAQGYLTFLVPASIPSIKSLAGKGSLAGFDVAFVGTSKVKVKNETLKSASIKSTGSIAQGSFTGDDLFFGSAKIALTLVAESKLPFNPNVMLESSADVELPSWRKPEVGQPVAGSADVTVSQH